MTLKSQRKNFDEPGEMFEIIEGFKNSMLDEGKEIILL